ncbi:MAG: DNA mismatch repair endonuclease MutH [Gammaproteobacteria bacterium]|nr:DNA mismatch repair endonuclease MutH [Gammaproteobacteria bacterium]
MHEIPPPEDINQLIQRTRTIAGMNLSELAHFLNIKIPENLKREKGWVGQLVEKLLGATAGNKAEPDFTHLGVELKTIPVDSKGKPCESTYVCVVPLRDITGLHWENSVVKAKLNHVLWVPVEADKTIPLANRRLGRGILWQADKNTESVLARDYNEFIDRIALGQVESIMADQGEILQIRPKAANASALTTGIGENGQTIQTLPRGFYLRPVFTKQILRQWQTGE